MPPQTAQATAITPVATVDLAVLGLFAFCFVMILNAFSSANAGVPSSALSGTGARCNEAALPQCAAHGPEKLGYYPCKERRYRTSAPVAAVVGGSDGTVWLMHW